ncbi:hypothetical protein BDZ97DRAFT_1790171, partial [Flammula alnicola]
MSKKVIIVGGHGEVNTSIIRNPAQKDDIQRLSATPLVLSLEHALGEGTKPLLIMVSAVDVRDRKKNLLTMYDQEDIAMSNQVWQSIGAYMQWKYEADKVL